MKATAGLQPRVYGAIEAGGTKFVCAVADADHRIIEQQRFPTTTPAATLQAVIDWYAEVTTRTGPVASLGIASFGPLDLDPGSATYGQLLPTPKAGWSGADLVGPLQRALECPVGLDTDVNAAALAEARHGAGRQARAVAYVTVGTGIGAGIVIGDAPVHGRLHPEVGHISLRRDPRDLGFAGHCPFHGDCLEGLASGPAILARWGCSLDQLPAGHDGPAIIANYLGQLAANLALTCAVDRVVFGGGVMGTPGLLELVRATARRQLNGYLQHACYGDAIHELVVEPGLGTLSGIRGALLLAEQAWIEAQASA
jgi:fructokinase